MSGEVPNFCEDCVSQLPALQLLMNIGYEYVTPEEAVRLRGGKTSGVLLDGVLESQLRKINRIRFKGQEYPFSEGNIAAAILALKDMVYDGLVRTNEKVYDLLTLGKSLPQTILGDTKSFQLAYIDWERAGKPDDPNAYHVTAEFVVDRPGLNESRRPDIVLFVNGIPLCVIECKSPAAGGSDPPVEQAVGQMIRNQRDDRGIPKLFVYAQLLLAAAKNEAKYATAGTAKKFWAVWKEREDTEEDVRQAVAKPLEPAEKERLFAAPFAGLREHFEALEAAGGREVTEQDRAIYALCRPGRLTELALRYTLFDNNEKKVARYQQFFTVREALKRIRQRDEKGRRRGGVIWHTQGSGKSLTMVMLAEAIAMEPDMGDYKIVLVTDRVDLDAQIYKTFAHCGAEVEQARTGSHLADLLRGAKKRIITTVINKFQAVASTPGARNPDPDIFVLVDEGHRGQFGAMHANMERVLPRACFIGFTGTPVMKRDRSTIQTFGGLIPPPYTIDQAVADKAVVPLLYEGRHVEQTVDSKSIDAWFERVTEKLSREQKADLKRKFARTDQLNKAERKVMRVAYDIGEHFSQTWKGTPFKAQLVAQNKATALLYKKYLDEFGMVSSEVLISGPDEAEGEEDVGPAAPAAADNAVREFWRRMVGPQGKYLTEKEYNEKVIDAFQHTESPEVIIVVDKLLTGFDAPRNTVLYLTRKLADHTLLQAIARVNRLHDGKDFGYVIDYRGVLGELDSAMQLYRSLAEFDAEDLAGTLTDVDAEVAKLPQRHSDVWALFGGLRGTLDPEPYERLLADDALRDEFYRRLSAFARTLGIALSSAKFLEQTPAGTVDQYKDHLKFFAKLRVAVKRRYAEEIDFGEYEPRIQKLIDTHVGTGEVEKLTPLVNIFDKDAFRREVEALTGSASKADTIAHRTKKTISERMAEDPAFYKRFSEMLEEAIRAFREQRVSDAEYLGRVQTIQEAVRDRKGDDVPEALRGHDAARAFFGVLRESFNGHGGDTAKAAAADAALRVDEVVRRHRIVNWTTNPDVQNRMRNEIDEFLYDLKKRHGLAMTLDEIEDVMEKCLDIARHRYP